MYQAAPAAVAELSNPLLEVAGVLLVDAQRVSSMNFEVNMVGRFSYGAPHNHVWSNSWLGCWVLDASSSGIGLGSHGTAASGIACLSLWCGMVECCW
jgi:hypothetical protein